MPKTKETKIPQPKMGVIVKSSGGNQYSMKQKPKVEEPALEILENVILTPDNGLQHTTEIIGEPEKPQAVGKTNLPLEAKPGAVQEKFLLILKGHDPRMI